MVVLAGGMATRFGGGVKAVAEAIDGRSFLEVKLDETAAPRPGARHRDPCRPDDELRHRRGRTRARGRERARASRSGSVRPLHRACTPTAACSSPPTGARRSTGRATATSLATIRTSGTLAELERARRPHDRRLERRQPRCAARPGRGRHAPARRDAAHGRGGGEGQRHGRCAGARRWPSAASRGDALPTGVRSGTHPGLQHQYLTDRGGRAHRAGRAHLARGREERRGAHRGAVRAAVSRALRLASRRRSSSCRATGRGVAFCRSRNRRISTRCSRFCARCSLRHSPSGVGFVRRHTSDTESSPSRYERRSSVGGWPCSTSSSRAGAASAAGSEPPCVTVARHGWSVALHLGATAAGRQAPGPCADAPNAVGGGSRSRRPGLLSSTTVAPGHSSPRGRSAEGVI